jgi:hypothetical protein
LEHSSVVRDERCHGLRQNSEPSQDRRDFVEPALLHQRRNQSDLLSGLVWKIKIELYPWLVSVVELRDPNGACEWTTRVLLDPAGNEFCLIGPD